MVKLITEVQTPESEYKIGYNDKIFSIGSCFADNIIERLGYYRFDCISNPFGVQYNPVSIAQSLERIANNTLFTTDDIIQTGNLYNSLHHHTSFAKETPESFISNANSSLNQSVKYLKDATFVIITFGTAWYYRYIPKDIVVSNCNKLNSKLFKRELLSINEITCQIDRIAKILTTNNVAPKLKEIIFTISPIRHFGDGAHGNQISKASLLIGLNDFLMNRESCCDKTVKVCNADNQITFEYFPSYEIMLDELRDYRFYNEDLCHPSPLAIKYIFEKFAISHMDKKTISNMKIAEKITLAERHRPFNTDSQDYALFIEKLNTLKSEFEGNYTNTSQLKVMKEKTD